MKLGLIGWRGMVGSVLMERMRAENDFEHIDPVFFHQVDKMPVFSSRDNAPLIRFSLESLRNLVFLETVRVTDHTDFMAVVMTYQGGHEISH